MQKTDGWFLTAGTLLQDKAEPVSTSADAAASRQQSPRAGRHAAAQSAQRASTSETRPARSRLARQTGAAGDVSCPKGQYLAAAKCCVSKDQSCTATLIKVLGRGVQHAMLVGAVSDAEVSGFVLGSLPVRQ